MPSTAPKNKFALWLKEVRLQFCTAAVIPVCVGSALAFAHNHQFDWTLFLLAVFSISFFQMGANVINDYFDSESKNDWLNANPTPFSGGSRLIQKNLLAPREVYIGSAILFVIASISGLAIAAITKSLLVLALGIIGLLGAYFYTAPPLKLGYRTAGEITIGLLFGILPVYGAYYIQTSSICLVPFIPSLFIAVLIFLVIFANEFPDYPADKAVNKKTLVVTLGVKKAAVLYKAALVLTIVLSLFIKPLPFKFIFYPVLIILCLLSFKACSPAKLQQPGYSALSLMTILLHTIAGAGLALAVLFG